MYVELHSRSAFSFLEGASIPEELTAVGSNLGMPAMALLDRDGVYGSPRFHLAAKKAKIKAHIGAEITTENIFFGVRVRSKSCRQLFLWCISTSAPGCFAGGISKSLPPDHENEIAGWPQRRGLRLVF